MSGYLPSLQTFAKGSIATLATVSTVSLSLLYYGQNYLIYPSAYISIGGQNRTDVDTPDLYGLHWEEILLETSDGEKLQCFLLRQRKQLEDPTRFQRISSTVINYDDEETDDEFMTRRPTVLMFHGNGGNNGHRIPLGMMFQLRMRCNVFMVEYRGYGQSTGAPSEPGIQTDAETALNYVLSDPRLKNTKILLYGQSLGGAVAIDLASRNPDKIAALILENTFTTLPSLVPHLFPFLRHLPYKWMCTEKWESANKIHTIPWTMPVLLLSGALDEIVPQEHMLALKDLFENLGDLVDDEPAPPPKTEEIDDMKGGESKEAEAEEDTTIAGETLSFATEYKDDDPDIDPPRRRHGFPDDPAALRSRRSGKTDSQEESVHSSAISSSSNEKLSESLPRSESQKTVKGAKRIREGKKRLTWVELPFGGHNDTATQRGYWDAVEDFMSPYTGILPRDIRKSERNRARELERRAEDRAREEARLPAAGRAEEKGEEELDVLGSDVENMQRKLREQRHRERREHDYDGSSSMTRTNSMSSSSSSFTSSLSGSTFSSEMSSLGNRPTTEHDRLSQLQREVDDMEEELRAMDIPQTGTSSSESGHSGAISTADLLREFGFDSYEKMKHEGDTVLRNAEKSLE